MKLEDVGKRWLGVSRVVGLVICILLTVFSAAAIGDDGDPCCTSPDHCGDPQPGGGGNGGGDAPLITFSEYPVKTHITNQYAGLGIIFDGDDPFISGDQSNPTAPVLSGSPKFKGNIEGYFINPYNGASAMVDWFSLDAGFFDQIQSTRLEWFDINGDKLGEVCNSIIGIETFYIEDDDIASWRIGMINTDSAGYAIDNIDFGDLSSIEFSKTDDVEAGDCREPGDEITYTICWDNTTAITYENTSIVDYLPEGVSYDSLVDDANYYPDGHYYVWDIGEIGFGDNGCVSLTVQVNENAEPGMYLNNAAELWDANSLVARNTEDVLVCCGDDYDIVYVDISARGYDIGTSWRNAYSGTDGLQKAIDRINAAECAGPYTIYVAQGVYDPNTADEKSFVIPDNVEVYGGFSTGGCAFERRNPDLYEAVLIGNSDR